MRSNLVWRSIVLGVIDYVLESPLVDALLSKAVSKVTAKPVQKVSSFVQRHPIPVLSTPLVPVVLVPAITKLALPKTEKPKLVEYVIEEHTTPKTNEAKAHWSESSPEDRQRFFNRPAQLLNKGYKKHWDVRIEAEGGKFKSFTTPKCRLPEEGEKILLIDSTIKHGYSKQNPGVIESGYGQGVSKVKHQGNALIWTPPLGKTHLTFEHVDRTYVFVKDFPNGDSLLTCKRPTIVLWRDRPWKEIKDISGDLTALKQKCGDRSLIAERKYDGTNSTLVVSKEGQVSLISRRPHVKNGEMVPTPGGFEGIDQSDKLIHVKYADLPDSLKGSEINCEVYSESTGGGKWTNPHGYTTSVLNSNPVRAEVLQQKHGRLRLKMLDIIKHQDLHGDTYEEKRKLMQTIHSQTSLLRVPKSAQEESAKWKLLQKEESRNFGEGVIFKSLSGKDIYKYKFKRSYDLKIVGFNGVSPMSESSKWRQKNGAGVFILENGQPIKILTDIMKIDVYEHPENYLGRVAVIEGMSMGKSGRVRAPVFIGLHQDK